MIIIKGYCLKYGPTKATHAPVKHGSLMREPVSNRDCGARLHLPFYISTYENMNTSRIYDLPDGCSSIYKRKDGIYAVCIIDDSRTDINIDIEKIKRLKLGYYATNEVENRNGEIVDGYIRYVNLSESNMEEIESIAYIKPYEEPIILYENKEDV